MSFQRRRALWGMALFLLAWGVLAGTDTDTITLNIAWVRVRPSQAEMRLDVFFRLMDAKGTPISAPRERFRVRLLEREVPLQNITLETRPAVHLFLLVDLDPQHPQAEAVLQRLKDQLRRWSLEEPTARVTVGAFRHRLQWVVLSQPPDVAADHLTLEQWRQIWPQTQRPKLDRRCLYSVLLDAQLQQGLGAAYAQATQPLLFVTLQGGQGIEACRPVQQAYREVLDVFTDLGKPIPLFMLTLAPSPQPEPQMEELSRRAYGDYRDNASLDDLTEAWNRWRRDWTTLQVLRVQVPSSWLHAQTKLTLLYQPATLPSVEDTWTLALSSRLLPATLPPAFPSPTPAALIPPWVATPSPVFTPVPSPTVLSGAPVGGPTLEFFLSPSPPSMATPLSRTVVPSSSPTRLTLWVVLCGLGGLALLGWGAYIGYRRFRRQPSPAEPLYAPDDATLTFIQPFRAFPVDQLPRLVVETALDPYLLGRAFYLDRDTVYLGQDIRNDLPLPQERVAPRHAEIKFRGDGFYLRPLAGHRVEHNGQTIYQMTRLQHGDRFRLGEHLLLRFVQPVVSLEAFPPVPPSQEAPGQWEYGPWHIAAQTHVGRKRQDKPNEDALAVWIPEKSVGHMPPLVLVADGMGGYDGGALASQVVVRTFQEYYPQNRQGQSNWADWLVYCTQMAHYQIHQTGREQHLQDMGSTVVAAALLPDRVIVVNVGDSRAYLWRDGHLQRISQDHSVVERLIQQGELTPEEARRHPKRGRLTQALSMRRSQVEPFVRQETWGPGHRLLLCSDGLWDVLPPVLLAAVLKTYAPPQAVARFIQLANAFGGPDNISVIVVAYRPYST